MKKLTAILMGAVIAISMSACAPKTNDEVVKTGKNGKITEKPLELSIFMLSDEPFSEKWKIFGKAAEDTNISLKGVLSKSASDRTQAFNLMMSSKDLPDIIQYYGRYEFFTYGEQGAFEDLRPLIDKYAPNIKKFLNENKEIEKLISTDDGKIYFIPNIPDGKSAEGWFIRKDWLDKLGLGIPDTLEDFHNVLTSFYNNDPNGNGKKDEIPYFNGDAGVNYENSISDLLPLFDAYKSWGIRDGKVVYGPIEDQAKNAYKAISQWYKEGIIDKEIYTRGYNARETLLSQNIGGVTFAYFGSTANFNDSLKDKVSGIEFIPFAPPTATNGKKQVFSVRDTISEEGWGISAQSKYKVEAIKYFDYWFSVKGRRLANFGIEGEEYTIKDGKPVFKDEVLHGEKSVVEQLRMIGAQKGFGYKQDFAYEEQWLNPIAKKGIAEYEENGYPRKAIKDFNFTSEEIEERNSIMGSIDSFVREYQQNWVLGSKSVDESFDEFVNTINDMGIERAIEITQNAYNRAK